MAITLDATVGGASSNSYVTIARSNAIAETLPHMGEWLTSAEINKSQLLLHATRLIDRHFLPNGAKVNDAQALLWPQSGLSYASTGTAIPENIIPEFVELATVEWAWELQENPYPNSDIADGLKTLNTPSYRMEFTGSGQKRVPEVVADLLSPYVRRQQRSFTRLVRM